MLCATLAAEPTPLTIDLDCTALIIIDMQRDFLEPGGFGAALGNDVSRLAAAIGPIRSVLDAARTAGMLVIHTREGHRPDLSDAPPHKVERGHPDLRIGASGPMGRILVRGEPGHDIIPELYPTPGEPVIDKPGKGAFYATDLELILRDRGIRTLIVCGVTTEVCVNTSVREANGNDLKIEWLKPFMHPRMLRAGEKIFWKGDDADEAFVVVEGRIEIVERGTVLSPGDIFGEMALFTKLGKRTATARCLSDVSLLVITYEQFEQLYFQNPEFGLYLVRLIVRRFETNHRDEELESA